MNFPACSPQPPINAECQAGKIQIPFFKVFWYDSTRGINPLRHRIENVFDKMNVNQAMDYK